MAFKMKGKPTIKGTKQHYKELKVAREATDNLPDGRSKSSPFQLSYEKSYTKEVEEKWKDKGGKDAYIKAAKDWNIKKYGTKEPTKEAKSMIKPYKDVTDVKSGKKKLEAITTQKAKEKVRTDAETKVFREKQAKETVEKRELDAQGPSTKKRTKAGKTLTKVRNIFRKKGKKKNPHQKNIASTKSAKSVKPAKSSTQDKQQKISDLSKKEGTTLSDAAKKLYA